MAGQKSLRDDMLDHLAIEAAAKILRCQDALEADPSGWALFVGTVVREAVRAAVGEKNIEADD